VLLAGVAKEPTSEGNANGSVNLLLVSLGFSLLVAGRLSGLVVIEVVS